MLAWLRLSSGTITRALFNLGLVTALGMAGLLATPGATARPSGGGDSTSTAFCPQPPRGMDLATLSNAQLAYYGLPLPPQGANAKSPAWQEWARVLHHTKVRSCTSTVSAGPDAQRWGPVVNTNAAVPNVPDYLGEEPAPTWSGVVALNNQTTDYYSQVSAEWTVPCPTQKPPAGGAEMGVWVGLDGSRSQDGGDGNLLQAGTATSQDINGSPFSYAWWEDFPADPNLITFPNNAQVQCGDSMYAEVIQNHKAPGATAYVVVDDYTQGGYFGPSSFSPQYPSNGSTAEWIVEAHSHLPNFGTLTFTQDYATLDGNSKQIGQLGTNAVRMYTCWPQSPSCPAPVSRAYPGPIHHNLFFNDYWQHY
jgi:hypothetical protein